MTIYLFKANAAINLFLQIEIGSCDKCVVFAKEKKALQRKLRGLENKMLSMKDSMAENQHNWVKTLQEIDQQRQVTVEVGE